MKIFVVNAGSSSLKYQLIDMENEQMIGKGNCERIGSSDSFLTHKAADGRSVTIEEAMPVIHELFTPGTTVLVKASHSMGFAQIAKELEETYQ